MAPSITVLRSPLPKFWREDMSRMRDSGLDTIQFWVTWAWVESKPGVFNFDDYDRLIEAAHEAGLKVVLSTVAELQPHWIHDVVPGSEMIDNRGQRVISSLREESHFGLTPGGCTENPAVWERMADFLRRAVLRYKDCSHLSGWDAWNEYRWHEQSDALVCFCVHCLREFRSWLDSRYGGLDGLNNAWNRRYGNWPEVMPGKSHWRPFTEMMAWQHFATWKANRHGRARYALIKSLDSSRPVVMHAGDPCPLMCGGAQAYALDRGNDWGYADDIDGVGCSHFPKLFEMDDTAFTTRIEFVRSAATSGGKKFWLSEVQGGRGSMGFRPSGVVTAAEQQRWIWQGVASGAEKLLFWCWRDEIFGRESSGFGLAGNDGHAAGRLAALTRTSQILQRHRALFASFVPAPPRVGVFFSPSTYYLHWALDGHAKPAQQALEGYCRSLVRQSIPYVVVEEEHLKALENLDVVFLPRVLVTSQAVEKALADFVRKGGTLVCEAECGAFTPEGLYRYPEERFLVAGGLLSGREAGRRNLPPDGQIRCEMPDGPLLLAATQWLAPWQGFPKEGLVLADHEDGALIGEAFCDNGRIVVVGTFLGDAASQKDSLDFDRFVGWCCRDAAAAPLASGEKNDALHRGYVRIGSSDNRPVAFVFLPRHRAKMHLSVQPGFFTSGVATDLLSGRTYPLPQAEPPGRIEIETDDHGIAVLTES